MRVPFGLCIETDKNLDIVDVPRGKACGCICPSCELPLISRQGKVQGWHFAHDTDFDDEKRYQNCSFSYQASVRLMIKQLLLEGSLLTTPEYRLHSNLGDLSIAITRQTKLEYEQIEFDVEMPEILGLLDVIMTINGIPLHIFISYKERPFRVMESLSSLKGLLELDIQELSLDSDELSSTEVLRKWIEGGTLLKYWKYHTRELEAKQKLAKEERRFIAGKPDDDLMEFCIQEVKQTMRKERGINPNQMGWRGLVSSEATKLFKSIRTSQE